MHDALLESFQNEDEPFYLWRNNCISEKTFVFSFGESVFMKPGFVAVFYRDAINPGLPNNNADGSAVRKVFYKVPRWKDPPGRKVAVSSLIIPDAVVSGSLTRMYLLVNK